MVSSLSSLSSYQTGRGFLFLCSPISLFLRVHGCRVSVFQLPNRVNFPFFFTGSVYEKNFVCTFAVRHKRAKTPEPKKYNTGTYFIGYSVCVATFRGLVVRTFFLIYFQTF